MSLKRLALGIGLMLALVGSLSLAASWALPHPLISLGESKGAPAGARGMELASDSKMAILPYNFEYVAGAELSDAEGTGKVYELKLEGTPEAVLERAAKAFGLKGEALKSSYWSAENPS